jgi:hypothetical protein
MPVVLRGGERIYVYTNDTREAVKRRSRVCDGGRERTNLQWQAQSEILCKSVLSIKITDSFQSRITVLHSVVTRVIRVRFLGLEPIYCPVFFKIIGKFAIRANSYSE